MFTLLHSSTIKTISIVTLAVSILGLGACDSKSNSKPDNNTNQNTQQTTTPKNLTPQFVDVTSLTGVDFISVCGEENKDYVIEVNGSGVALFDYDNDGDLDIFFVNGSQLPQPYGSGVPNPAPSDKLYENLGNFHFKDVTDKAGLTEEAWGCGVTVGDIDNDGFQDLFVANYGQDALWRNKGDGTFENITLSAGTTDPLWGASPAFLDYNRDGLLDLFIVNYLDFDPKTVKRRGTDPNCQYKGQPILCGPIGLPPTPCTLYKNLGNGKFEDVSTSSGIRKVKLEDATYGLGVSIIDANNDGWIDIYVANDTRPNLLFENQKDGTFKENALHMGIALNDEAIAQAGMGVDTIYMGEREIEDLFVVNYEDDSNTYYKNEGNGFFTEMTTPLGLSGPCFKFLGWGTFFFDSDLDGDQDLFIAQGHVVPQANQIRSSPGYNQPNKLFQYKDETFVDSSRDAGPGFEVILSSRGAAHGDLDGDGDSDIVINNIDGPATILMNEGSPKHNWVAIQCQGTTSNRDGLGAIVTLRAAGKTQRRRIKAGASYASHSETVARFGLGSATAIESIEISWPNGEKESFPAPKINQKVTLVEGKGTKK